MFGINELEIYEPKVGPYESIVWHHSLTLDRSHVNDFSAIRNFHILNRGWRDIGYNIVIERDKPNGRVMAKWGRPLGMSGAHCKENRRNYTSVGICIVGNYDKGTNQHITEEHYKVAGEVVAKLNKHLGITLKHEKHSQHATYKTCPGSAFPFEDFVNSFKSSYDDVDNSKWYNEAITYCKDNGLMVGNNNKFRPEEYATRAELAQVLYNLSKKE